MAFFLLLLKQKKWPLLFCQINQQKLFPQKSEQFPQKSEQFPQKSEQQEGKEGENETCTNLNTLCMGDWYKAQKS